MTHYTRSTEARKALQQQVDMYECQQEGTNALSK